MTDLELRELAAKAAGVCLHPEDQLHKSYGNWGCDTTCMACKQDPSLASWNPLADDRAALRLVVQLGLEVSFVDDDDPDGRFTRACVGYPKSDARPCAIAYVFEDHKGDIFSATRRAIVRAAAEIGKRS